MFLHARIILLLFQTVVYMPNNLTDFGLLMEAMTRARKRLIFVITKGSPFWPLMKHAEGHATVGCDLKNCFFRGSVLFDKQQVIS